MSPFAQQLFEIASPRPLTEEERQALADEPQRPGLTEEDVNRLAAIHDETFNEGRIHRHNFRTNFHE